jgi:hypothetical protein
LLLLLTQCQTASHQPGHLLLLLLLPHLRLAWLHQ